MHKAFNERANAQFYDGYVRTCNKASKQQFKDASKRLAFDQTAGLAEFGGVLAKDIIMVDVDDRRASEVLLGIIDALSLNCRVIKTTRGKHFMFRRGTVDSHATGVMSALGIEYDIKTGNKAAYAVLKFDGVVREIERAEDGRVDVLPEWLRPVKGAPNFFAMSEGDGRNDALYGYIWRLQRAGFTVETIKETLTIINTYVLRDPVSEEELAVIMRDEAFAQTPSSKRGARSTNEMPSFYNGKEFLFGVMGDYLIEAHHIKRINKQLHMFEDGIYVDAHGRLNTLILDIATVNRAKRREVIDYIDSVVNAHSEVVDARYIAFENGVLDIGTGELLEPTPELVIVNRINCTYDANAYHKLVDETLDRMAINDASIRALLEECAGYCLYRRNELGKAFILTGEKANGKSTFLSMVKAMLGDENVSSLDINEMGDRFSSAMLFGKLANIGDDISDDFLQGTQVSLFKKITTGERIKAERKGCDPFEFDPYVKLLFSANDMPRMRDKTGAVLRRLVIIPFNARFSKSDSHYDPYIKYRLTKPDALAYLARIGVEGLKRVLIANGFTTSAAAERELAEYEAENNPIVAFLEEYERERFVGLATSTAYRMYSAYCDENGQQAMASNVFGRQLCKRLQLESKLVKQSGKVGRFYADIDTVVAVENEG